MAKAVSASNIILGIDPGTNFMGYGIIEVKNKELMLISMGTINLSKFDTHQDKLKRIYDRVSWLIKEFCPHDCAIEAPFFGKNVQSMLKLGRAQGVAMAAAINHGLEICEYSPKKIKQSVTGNGNASKEQVAAMLQQTLKFKESPKFLDATDGLAVAVCHHYQSNSVFGKGKQFKGWKEFISANPDKVK